MAKRGFSAEKMRTEVEAEWERFYCGGTNDSVFIGVTIPAFGDSAYFEMLNRIIHLGINQEKSPNVTKYLDEEGIRDHFLPHLNSIFIRHSATSETFNKKARTDILLQVSKGTMYLLQSASSSYGNEVDCC
jgi:hypothetical protein